MGNMFYAYVTNPDTAPDINNPPTFPPLYGFPNGREERTIRATRKQLQRARVPLDRRDYCVDYYMVLMHCRRTMYPRTISRCKRESCAYNQCEYEDYVMRMKEYEREKRLKERENRKRCGVCP